MACSEQSGDVDPRVLHRREALQRAISIREQFVGEMPVLDEAVAIRRSRLEDAKDD